MVQGKGIASRRVGIHHGEISTSKVEATADEATGGTESGRMDATASEVAETTTNPSEDVDEITPSKDDVAACQEGFIPRKEYRE